MNSLRNAFESIKHITEYDAEFWYARELMPLLGYETWRRFENAIDRAKEACENSNKSMAEEFLPAPAKTLDSAGRPSKDYILSRYACYLIAQNGDPRKLEIAQAQTRRSLWEIKSILRWGKLYVGMAWGERRKVKLKIGGSLIRYGKSVLDIEYT